MKVFGPLKPYISCLYLNYVWIVCASRRLLEKGGTQLNRESIKGILQFKTKLQHYNFETSAKTKTILLERPNQLQKKFSEMPLKAEMQFVLCFTFYKF